ncbi:MAG: DUF3375 domain-containing protein [Acidiferrobacter sp.]
MTVDKTLATYRRLRTAPLWRLLAADHGPAMLALLQTHLYDGDRRLPASILHERVGCELEALRARGEDFPQTAQAYVAAWLAEGYLERRFPIGATEEEYELSAAAIDAIRFVAGLAAPHAAATESRLALVMQALEQLAEDTDSDSQRRTQRLLAERARIDSEMAAIGRGELRILADDAARERLREVMALAADLIADFRRVRTEFERLNRELRERLMDHDGARGAVLAAVFAGIDVIAESEAGRTFAAFWRLLTDPEQAATLEQALDEVLSRPLVARLDSHDRRFLLRLTHNLLEQGGQVHDVLQTFARSLKHFVQSREYLEQRRINQLLRDAQRMALGLKDAVRATESLPTPLTLTSSRVRSLAQWVLYDPALQSTSGTMRAGDPPTVDLAAIGTLVAQSEIDFGMLKAQVRAVLTEHAQASIAEILAHFPARQGLGSVVGLIALGSRHGVPSAQHDTIAWVGGDHTHRQARIPRIFFVREHLDEWS